MEWQKDGYLISTDKQKLDVAYIHRFLSRESYWAQGIPRSTVTGSIEGSLTFGIYRDDVQMGFARVITDEATFGYLADVFVDKAHRGRGLSKWLMEVICSYPSLQGLRRMLLATRDAHGLYSQFGFTPLTHPENFLNLHRPDLYKREEKGA